MSDSAENSLNPTQSHGSEKDIPLHIHKIIRSTKPGIETDPLLSLTPSSTPEDTHSVPQTDPSAPPIKEDLTSRSAPRHIPTEEKLEHSVPEAPSTYTPREDPLSESKKASLEPQEPFLLTPQPSEDFAVDAPLSSPTTRKEQEAILQDVHAFDTGIPIPIAFAQEASYPESSTAPPPSIAARTIHNRLEAVWNSSFVLVLLVVLNVLVASLLIALFVAWMTNRGAPIDALADWFFRFWRYGLSFLGAFLAGLLIVGLIRHRLLATSYRYTRQGVTRSNGMQNIDPAQKPDTSVLPVLDQVIPQSSQTSHVPPDSSMPAHQAEDLSATWSSAPASSPIPNEEAAEPKPQQSSTEQEPSFKAVEWEDVLDRPLEDDSDQANHPHIKVFPDPQHRERNKLRNDWQVIGASRRGLGHIYDGKYREDDFSIQHVGDDIVVIAIADGIGSKSLSRHGARAAVLGATSLPDNELKHLAERIRKQDFDKASSNEVHQMAWDLLMRALQQAARKVRERADQDNALVSDLHSTLLVFLAVPYKKDDLYVASTQVGDGAICALQPGKGSRPSQKWRYLQTPQVQDVGNDVIPFMSTNQKDWEANFKPHLLTKPGPMFLMAMTDGIVDDIALPVGTEIDEFTDVERFYAGVYADVLSKKDPVQAAETLAEFLDYRIPGSFDDRTLVCIYRKQ